MFCRAELFSLDKDENGSRPGPRLKAPSQVLTRTTRMMSVLHASDQRLRAALLFTSLPLPRDFMCGSPPSTFCNVFGCFPTMSSLSCVYVAHFLLARALGDSSHACDSELSFLQREALPNDESSSYRQQQRSYNSRSYCTALKFVETS